MNKEDAAALALRLITGTTTPEDLADLHIPLAPVDLRTVPRDHWKEFLLRSVTVPPDLEPFLAGQSTFSQSELNAIEDRLAAFHGVTAPFYITAKAGPPFDAWLGFDTHDHSHSTI